MAAPYYLKLYKVGHNPPKKGALSRNSRPREYWAGANFAYDEGVRVVDKKLGVVADYRRKSDILNFDLPSVEKKLGAEINNVYYKITENNRSLFVIHGGVSSAFINTVTNQSLSDAIMDIDARRSHTKRQPQFLNRGILQLPFELDNEAVTKIAAEFAAYIAIQHATLVKIVIHSSNNSGNKSKGPHLHFSFPTRRIIPGSLYCNSSALGPKITELDRWKSRAFESVTKSHCKKYPIANYWIEENKKWQEIKTALNANTARNHHPFNKIRGEAARLINSQLRLANSVEKVHDRSFLKDVKDFLDLMSLASQKQQENNAPDTKEIAALISEDQLKKTWENLYRNPAMVEVNKILEKAGSDSLPAELTKFDYQSAAHLLKEYLEISKTVKKLAYDNYPLLLKKLSMVIKKIKSSKTTPSFEPMSAQEARDFQKRINSINSLIEETSQAISSLKNGKNKKLINVIFVKNKLTLEKIKIPISDQFSGNIHLLLLEKYIYKISNFKSEIDDVVSNTFLPQSDKINGSVLFFPKSSYKTRKLETKMQEFSLQKDFLTDQDKEKCEIVVNSIMGDIESAISLAQEAVSPAEHSRTEKFIECQNKIESINKNLRIFLEINDKEKYYHFYEIKIFQIAEIYSSRQNQSWENYNSQLMASLEALRERFDIYSADVNIEDEIDALRDVNIDEVFNYQNQLIR